MSTPHIIILGGGYAGVVMAYRMAGKIGKQAKITLIDAKAHFVERIRLHQWATAQQVPQRLYSDLFKGKPIDFVQGWVSALNPTQKSVTVRTATGENTLHYDYLAYALGSSTDKNAVPGVAEYTYNVGAETEAQRLRDALAPLTKTGGKVAVVGGGLTGIETATELAEQYPTLKVHLVTRGGIGDQLSRKAQAYLHQTMAELGIVVEENVTVTRIHEKQMESNKGTIAFDLCIWSGPFKAAPLAQESGVQTNHRGQIVVDGLLRSLSHPTIYGVGDAADLSQATTTPIRMACATALPMGAFAADQVSAKVLQRPTDEPFRFAYAGQCISLGRNRAVVQMVDHNDTPEEKILTGRLGAFVKESICRYTVFGLMQERYLPGTLYYPKPPKTAESLQPASLSK